MGFTFSKVQVMAALGHGTVSRTWWTLRPVAAERKLVPRETGRRSRSDLRPCQPHLPRAQVSLLSHPNAPGAPSPSPGGAFKPQVRAGRERWQLAQEPCSSSDGCVLSSPGPRGWRPQLCSVQTGSDKTSGTDRIYNALMAEPGGTALALPVHKNVPRHWCSGCVHGRGVKRKGLGSSPEQVHSQMCELQVGTPHWKGLAP